MSNMEKLLLKKIPDELNQVKWLLVIIFAVFFVATGFFFKFTVDDAYIVTRYAENFVDLGSLIFNSGEQINALTSPLHALIEALLYQLTGATLTSYKILSLLFLISSAMLVAHQFRNNSFAFAVCLSGILLAPSVILWTFGGLETPLLLFLRSVLSVVVYSTREFQLGKLCLIYLLAGLAFVTRYDALLYIAPLIIYASIKGRSYQNVLIVALLGSFIPLLWLLISHSYYGDILPTSYYVKKPIFKLSLIQKNFIYIGQYLVFVGIIPFSLFLTFSNITKKQRVYPSRIHLNHFWPFYIGILLVLGYGLSVATTHMMFSFRFFVPYIPAVILVIADLFRQSTASWQHKREQMQVRKWFNAFMILLIAVQSLQFVYIYKYSLNPVIIGNAEFSGVGVKDSESIMELPTKTANDIRQHWESLPTSEERPPRISTYAAGILPYSYKQAYIYETLISYRHHCRYNWRLSADYINILSPLHGSIESQLPEPLESYTLISSNKILFEGTEEKYLVFYNPNPEANKLPKKIDESCQ